MSGYIGLYRAVNEPDYDRQYEEQDREEEIERFEPIECVQCGLQGNALDETAAGFVYANGTDGDLVCAKCDASVTAREIEMRKNAALKVCLRNGELARRCGLAITDHPLPSKKWLADWHRVDAAIREYELSKNGPVSAGG